MHLKKGNSIQNPPLTPRLHKYRLLNSKSKLICDPKAFINLSSDIVSLSPSVSLPKPTIAFKVLNSQRSSCALVRKTYTQDNETSRDSERPRNNLNLLHPIYVQFKIDSEVVRFNSFASTAGHLLEQIKKIVNLKKISSQPFVLSTQDNDHHLQYYLSLPASKLIQFLGKSLKLCPFFLAPQRQVGLGSFHIVKAIGSGGFSKVFLGRFKGDGMFYAMKVISKSFILKQKKKQLVVNERNIMVEINHPLHAKLYWSFESKHSIIFVMDYYLGGELFGLIKRYHRMSQTMAKFYIVEILLALQKLHDSGIAYRDMKPENILLDRQGHVHLADFGLAKPGLKDDSARAYSFCGSPEYMPPEVVARKGHTLTADFYSMGALLYELVTGLPPFYNRDPQKIYTATLKQNLAYPSNLSSQLRNLLQGLLCKEHENRLGSRFGVRQILTHAWFGKISVSDYLEMKVTAPITFTLYADITFNQEEMQQKNEELVMALKKEQAFSSHFEHIFQNFYFNRQEKEAQFVQEQLRAKTPNIFTKLSRRQNYGCSSSTSRLHHFNNFI